MSLKAFPFQSDQPVAFASASPEDHSGDGASATPSSRSSPRLRPAAGPLRLPMPCTTPGQVAFSVVQFLPLPVLVLGAQKTVVLANEAMGKLLGMMHDAGPGVDRMVPVMDRLRGRSLSDIGIDLVQDDVPVWVDWNQLLDQAAIDARRGATLHTHTPGSPSSAYPSSVRSARRRLPSDLAIEVSVSPRDTSTGTHEPQAAALKSQVHAKMLVSPWVAEDNETFFTLTFTKSDLPSESRPVRPPSAASSSVAKPISNADKMADTPPLLDNTMLSPPQSDDGAGFRSPSPFPPSGSPLLSPKPRTPSVLQKITVMKDALLDKIDTPILAVWKDGSVTFPNRAARSLFNRKIDDEAGQDGFNLLPSWTVWSEDFSRQLDPSEDPICILIRTETPFACRRIGMHDANGQPLVFDVEGAALRDDDTGEFLAGVITYRDVTRMTEEISQIKAADEERFERICDTMPQLVWTAARDGRCDFFNSRWYGYSGLSEAESVGWGWLNVIHPEDAARTGRRWQHSLKTGEPYVTEYRCRGKNGEWRWFLGRALPLKNRQTGEIEKWFGTCTDVHENIETKIEAKRTREQLLSVIALSHITMFTVDRSRRVTMLEGALIWDSQCDSSEARWYIGENIYDVFNRLNSQLPEGQMPPFLKPLEPVLSGEAAESLQEHEIAGRWYRTRIQPILGKPNSNEGAKSAGIEGVIGFIMDVTELKAREQDLQAQALEKRQLLANEAAAKEASRLKSQFLANMSHEIRTPISGVIGMAELLMGAELGGEQRELVENIHRSANALLTVINDILDFSKVESGRLDVEEVRFSLPVVIRDVTKMLSFSAERKGLAFHINVATDIESDLAVLGDPGRVRQILTNLLANGIKFTVQGFVKLSVVKARETAEQVEIKFEVEDTGVGIEADVQKRLFQPFYQGDASTARRFGGTGLGLSISKTLVELMKGRITLQSRKGAGTTVIFWIPFKRAQPHETPNLLPLRPQSETTLSCSIPQRNPVQGTATTDEQSATGTDNSRSAWRRSSSSLLAIADPEETLPRAERGDIHVLVVEDNPINRQFAVKSIQKLGFQATAVWNGKEALDYLAAAREGTQRKPDIVLMDVQMPIIDGYKCTHQLRHHLPFKDFVQDIPIVAMTASAIQGDREKCKRAGMDDYLAKPVTIKTLERMLVRWSTQDRALPTERSRTGGLKQKKCCRPSQVAEPPSVPHIGGKRGLDQPTVEHVDAAPSGRTSKSQESQYRTTHTAN